MRIQTFDLAPGPYGAEGSGTQRPTLTAYLQDTLECQAGRRRPAVIVVPGGGYEFCSDREAEPVALAFVARGYQAFVLDYTVLDEREGRPLLPFPQHDLAHAVSLVRERAEELLVDPERLALVGFSAGGHLCLTYAALSRDEAFAREAGCEGRDLSVAALVLGYPVTDMVCGWPGDPARVARLCADERLLRPQDLVGTRSPRTFVWHTATDGTVPVAGTYHLAAALAAAGVDHECHVFHAGRHGLSLATGQTAKDAEQTSPHVARWLDLAAEWLGW